jgi:hypothetical protein
MQTLVINTWNTLPLLIYEKAPELVKIIKSSINSKYAAALLFLTVCTDAILLKLT